MKHAGPATLRSLEALLAQLRGLPGLVEKRPGIFYLKSKAYLHFHEDPAGAFADARLNGDEFHRFPVNTKHEQESLLKRLSRRPSVKMILTPATTPDEYVAYLTGWQRAYVEALRDATRRAAPDLEERLKWGHLVYFCRGPAVVIRAEPQRVLFGFMRGQRLRHIEPHLKPGGKYEMATLELRQDTPLRHESVVQLATEAARLNLALGDPTRASRAPAGAKRP